MKKIKMIGALTLLSSGLAGCNLIPQECQHEFGPWVTIEKATCSKAGLQTHQCILCNKEKSKKISASDELHKWVADPGSDKEATCQEEGIEGSLICQYCHEKKDGTPVEVTDHNFVVMAPQPSDPKYHDSTCAVQGVRAYQCDICNKIEDRLLPLGDHEFVYGNPIGKFTTVTCENCDYVGYELSIGDASGWKEQSTMNKKSNEAPQNASTWSLAGLPKGSYDVLIEAKTSKTEDQNKKFYNMADTEAFATAEDVLINASSTSKDLASEATYRYSVKVDGNVYNPKLMDSFDKLGLQPADVHSSQYQLINFIQGINIGRNSKNISLVHNDLSGCGLLFKSIRLVPHVHDDNIVTVPAGNGSVEYKYQKCSCGYRGITIEAENGRLLNNSTSTGAPNGYLKLNGVGQSVSYSFSLNADDVKENIVGDLYMYGRQSGYPANSDKTPYNCSWMQDEKEVELTTPSAVSSDFFGTDADANMAGYSELDQVLVGHVEMPTSHEINLKYTVKGDYDLTIDKIVIEGQAVDHIHDYWRLDPEHGGGQTCTEPGKIAYVCDCGEFITVESGTPKGHVLNKSVINVYPTCKSEGSMTLICEDCGEKIVGIPIPKTHDMKPVTAGTALFTHEACAICGENYAQWNLSTELIKDYDSSISEYKTSTTAVHKTGKMSNGSTNMDVFKFDEENRKVELSFHNPGEATEVTLRMLVSAKVADVANCNMYKENGENRFNINVNYGDEDHAVTFDSSKDNKTIEDLGVNAANVSAIDDDGKLADAVWVDYCTFQIGAGENTITFEVANADGAEIYIGGFALSYIA